MSRNERIGILVQLGQWFRQRPSELTEGIYQASIENPWFGINSIHQAIDSITNHYLNEEKLEEWVKHYSFTDKPTKKIGLIMAGNIPLVGFHDVLCVFMSGHQSLLKLAQKDSQLWPVILESSPLKEERFSTYFKQVEKLQDVDAILATGSDNTARYFNYYFGKYPHIIRKNRTGVAVLSGLESDEELIELGKDVFTFFGLGCRNVSCLLLPPDFNFQRLLQLWIRYKAVKDNNSYHNNYDYNIAIYTMGNIQYMSNEAIALVQDNSLNSRLAALNYQFYDHKKEVIDFINEREDQIQVVVSTMDLSPIKTIKPGTSQNPGLMDYPDGIDTINFLQSL